MKKREQKSFVPKNTSPSLGMRVTGYVYDGEVPCPIYRPMPTEVRSLRCVGGHRESRRYTRKRAAHHVPTSASTARAEQGLMRKSLLTAISAIAASLGGFHHPQNRGR